MLLYARETDWQFGLGIGLLALSVVLVTASVPALVERAVFSCSHESFTIMECRMGARTVTTYRVADYVRHARVGRETLLVMADDVLVRLPCLSRGRAAEIVEFLEDMKTRNEVLRRGEMSDWPRPVRHWAEPLQSRQVPPPPVKIDGPGGLRALISQYRQAVVFQEALPPAFDLARMFMTLRSSNGGLALFGVSPDGTMIGLGEEEETRARRRLAHLASELTAARVEVGRIELDGKVAVFAVFNLIPPHTRPIEPFAAATSEVAVV